MFENEGTVATEPGMKTAICYYSRHHGNTLKVLEAMAEEGEVDLIDVTTRQLVRLEEYDCVGFASGIYGFEFQKAVVEFARHAAGLAGAHSSELSGDTPHPVIDLMEEQKGVTEKGGTMRLGGYPCTLEKGSKAYAAYGRKDIVERHRHRYEFNNDYLDEFVRAGLKPVGVNPDTNLVEVVEMQDHPWFIGVQYHPEYKSTALHPHPLFVSFVKASTQYCKDNNGCK